MFVTARLQEARILASIEEWPVLLGKQVDPASCRYWALGVGKQPSAVTRDRVWVWAWVRAWVRARARARVRARLGGEEKVGGGSSRGDAQSPATTCSYLEGQPTKGKARCMSAVPALDASPGAGPWCDLTAVTDCCAPRPSACKVVGWTQS